MKFEVSDVKKLISSVANMVDAGIELHSPTKAAGRKRENNSFPLREKADSSFSR